MNTLARTLFFHVTWVHILLMFYLTSLYNLLQLWRRARSGPT